MACWSRGATIGRGSTATVSLATVSGQLLAAKSCPLSSSSSFLQHEETILSSLGRCHHIVSCFGHDVTPDPDNGQQLYNLFLEYLSGGPLINFCSSLPDSTIKTYTRSILEGLSFLHLQGYVYCDIKPHNILVTGCRNAVKIADFGLAKKRFMKTDYSVCGAPLYMSPESVSRSEHEAPSDIWSLGCVVVEMMTGKPAWGPQSKSRNGDVYGLLMKIGFGDEVPEIPAEASDEARDFLMRCFVRDPGKRWTAEMLLNHSFVAGVDQAARVAPSPTSVLEFRAASDHHEDRRSSMSLSVNCCRERDDRIAMLAMNEGRECWCEENMNEGWISVRRACC